MKVLDLFSGIGGFSLGLEQVGMETVAFCEIEPYARAVLKKHWPDVPIFEDVTKLTASSLAERGIKPDVICGGFPCQDISNAGRRTGITGSRSGLWFEFARLIEEIRPSWVIAENVAALRSRGLDAVLGSLAEIGYDAEWHCIPASAVGAPHIRDRIWIIAYPQHSDTDSERLHREEKHEQASTAQFRHEQERDARSFCGDVADAISPGLEGCAGISGDNADELRAIERGCTVLADASGKRFNGQHPLLRAKEGRGEADLFKAAGCSEDVANTPGAIGKRVWSQQSWEQSKLADQGWWFAEPDVGGTLDGFPGWLHRFVGWGLTFEESRRRVEILRQLWSPVISQALWQAIGGLDRFSQAQILFAFVQQYQTHSDKARLLLASQEAFADFVRGVWRNAATASTSYRPKYSTQHAGKYPNVMQVVSQLFTCHGQTAWETNSWEDGIPRVANGVANRVDRLKCLGNSLVPQIPALIGKAIMDAEKAKRK